ncbi:hypothetical protein FRC12_022235 [Ceratobasidium sp. 428]|nr:hypothetical protein FRC12_022235 [Ceratobasidium sp. 428]
MPAGQRWSVWIPALILECIMFALTAVRAWQYSKDGMQIPIVKALYRDGFQYFIGIMLCTLLPLLVWCVAPPTLVALPKYGTMAIINVLGFRIVLNLRAYCANPSNLTTFQEYEMQDHHTCVGYTDLTRVIRTRSDNSSVTWAGP